MLAVGCRSHRRSQAIGQFGAEVVDRAEHPSVLFWLQV
jgi:hypothetical protein